MRAVIITVAGTSSRFNKDLQVETLKCMYYENNEKDTLLYQMLLQCQAFDKIVVVGGYLFERLEDYIEKVCKEFKDNIILVENIYYEAYGSCYSLYLGIDVLQNMDIEEIVFAEGDLFFDKQSFYKISTAKEDVVTVNREAIYAKTAVVLYVCEHKKLHYLYDVKHGTLEIKEPFLAVFNSGQVWKFADADKLKYIAGHMSEERKQGTNLEIVQEYFETCLIDTMKLITFEKWVNCNTVDDYHKIQKEWEGDNR